MFYICINNIYNEVIMNCDKNELTNEKLIYCLTYLLRNFIVDIMQKNYSVTTKRLS